MQKLFQTGFVVLGAVHKLGKYVSTLGQLVGQPNANLVNRPYLQYLVKMLTKLVGQKTAKLC